MDARFYPKYEWKEYSLVDNGEVIVKATDREIAKKWLEQEKEKGNETACIIENLDKEDTCILY